ACTLSCASVGSCCAHYVTVEAPPGNIIGTVSQRESCCVPNYTVLDEHEREILLIDSPDCCELGCGCGDKFFEVRTLRDDDIGNIQKKWAGLLQESFTDADTFGVNFPIDLSVRIKAILIGATFLIDFIHFE
ncbi:hypothetical protein PMAYCL1PPCAC_14437, partial [Pristionchus mayeri]